MGFIVNAIKKVVKAIGRALGIYTHNKIISDIQITNLLTPHVADKSARHSAVRGSSGDGNKFAEAYSAFKRDYRKKYSASFLTSLGYAPNTTAQANILKPDKVRAYLDGKIPSVERMITCASDFVSDEIVWRHHLQENYEWSNTKSVLTVENGTKEFPSPVVTKWSGTLVLDFTRDFTDTIEDALKAEASLKWDSVNRTVTLNSGDATFTIGGVASSGSSSVTVNVEDSNNNIVSTKVFDTSDIKAWSFTSAILADGNYTSTVIESDTSVSQIQKSHTILVGELYRVEDFSSEIHEIRGVRSYKVDFTLISDGAITNGRTVAVDELKLEVLDNDVENLYVKYAKHNDSDWYIYLESIDNITPSAINEVQEVAMTAIIPLKEKNLMVDLDGHKLSRMLSKLNLSPGQLIDSLQNPSIDNAYLMTGIAPNNTDGNHINKAIFQSFEFYSPGQGTTTVTMNQLHMMYKFHIQKTDRTGRVGKIGTYIKFITGSGANCVMTMRWQASDTIFREIIISQYYQQYTISNQQLVAYLDSDSKYSRVIIPLDVLNKLKYKEFVDVYEAGLCMLAFSMEVVEVKWYETGAFAMLLKIVAVVVTIVTMGTDGGTVGSFLMSMANAIAVQYVIKLALEILGPELGAAFVILVMVALTAAGNFGGLSNIKTYLKLATSVLETMNQALSIKTEEMLTFGKEKLQEMAQKQSELDSIIQSLNGGGDDVTMMLDSFDDTYNSKPPNGMMDPNNYFANMLGEGAFDFDQLYDVDSAIESRKITRSG